MIGIDVYHGDNEGKNVLDFKEINSTLDFVIIKATDGQRVDPQLMNIYNQTLALKQGLYAYTYATNTSTAKAEAEAFCRAIKPLKHEMGLWLDVEDKRQKKLNKSDLTNVLNAWAVTAAKFGIEIGIYSNPDWLEHRLDMESIQITKLWLAVWTNDLSKLIKYRQKYKPDIIQYTDAYKLANGNKVDGDLVL